MHVWAGKCQPKFTRWFPSRRCPPARVPHAAQQSYCRRGIRKKATYPKNQATVVHEQVSHATSKWLRVLHRELQLRTYTARSRQPAAASGAAESRMSAAEPLCRLIVVSWWFAVVCRSSVGASFVRCSGFEESCRRSWRSLRAVGMGKRWCLSLLGREFGGWSVRHCQQGPAGVVTSLFGGWCGGLHSVFRDSGTVSLPFCRLRMLSKTAKWFKWRNKKIFGRIQVNNMPQFDTFPRTTKGSCLGLSCEVVTFCRHHPATMKAVELV